MIAKLRGQPSPTSGDISTGNVEGQGVAVGYGAQAANQKMQAGGDIINSQQIINLGTLVYGRNTSEDERRQLVWYLHSLTNTLDQLPLQGIEQRLDQQGQGMSLSSVYTSLKVRGYRRSSATEAGTRHQRLVLLGNPGGGKSTFVRHLTLTLARRELGEPVDDTALPDDFAARLPIILPLQKLARYVATKGNDASTVFDALADEIQQRHNVGDVHGLLRGALHRGIALPLFDGLDEVPVEGVPGERASRLETLQAVRAFALLYSKPETKNTGTQTQNSSAADQPETVPIAVTCRERAFTDDLRNCLGWSVETLAPFDMDQVRQFVPAWYAELAKKTTLTSETAQRYSERLVERVASSRQLQEMAGTPLLLTMMALVLYNNGDLPRDRPKLYENILDLLLGRWDTVQERGGQTLSEYIGLPDWDSQRLLPLLDRLSYEAHRTAASEDGRGRLTKATVRDTLIAFFEQAKLSEAVALEKTGRCLEYIQQRSGLLMPDGDASYVFAHLTLQEHCAGRYIVLGSEDPVKLVLEHRADDRWREPIMLGLGLAPPADLDDVLEALWEREEAGQPKSGERWGHDLMLAVEIGNDREWAYLQTLPRIKVSKHQEQLRRGMITLLEERNIPTKLLFEVAASLAQVGDPRLLDPATGNSPDERYWCPVEAGTFWYGDDRPGREEKELSPDKYEPKRLAKLQQMRLDYSFQIARFPVTNAEYARFIAAGGYEQQEWWTKHGWNWKRSRTERNYWDDSRYNSPAQPVVGVSWYESVAYCRWLTHQGHAQGWLPKEQEIRLPTSLEWERAARHTDQRPYPWGWEEPTPERANYDATGIDRPSPVGCFAAGVAVCGAQDMAGNVLEWLATPYGQSEQEEPEKDFTTQQGVFLSGSAFWRGKGELLCGSRNGYYPDYRDLNRGFRVLQSLSSSV
jgi:formylglycine-generating enzyme required for sulfatase activity/energy-coupling factor transporter ATP-binding protein EcfA2